MQGTLFLLTRCIFLPLMKIFEEYIPFTPLPFALYPFALYPFALYPFALYPLTFTPSPLTFALLTLHPLTFAHQFIHGWYAKQYVSTLRINGLF